MRLKQIKLAGFKSFVDTTKISFQQQMTAIVGPNGCGKSNVIDAVRWVLGESSAKNLRGDAMTDVIFNGATTRKPIGQASVELIFENTQGRLQGSMADRSEVAVKRLVTRDGNNSYFLNGSKCRRRDITDIFLGTGLGPRSYAIIEQGTISRLIESKPQELRVFIEEAAGISKYKEKRKDTENRISHTRENLVRLTDVIAQLTIQIDKLHQQSEAAKRFKTLKASERKYKAELAALRWQQFDQKAQQAEQKKQAQQLNITQLQTQQHKDEAAILKAKQALIEIDENVAKLQQQKLSLSNDITRVEQAIKYQQQQIVEDKKTTINLNVSLDESNKVMVSHQQKLTQIQKDIVKQQAQFSVIEQELEANQNKLSDQQAQLQRCTVLWDKMNEKVQQQQHKLAQLNADIHSKQSLLIQCEEQINHLQSTRENIPSSNNKINTLLLEEINQQKENLTALHDLFTQQQNKLVDERQNLRLQQENIVVIKTKLHTLTEMHKSHNPNKQLLGDNWQAQQNKWLTAQQNQIVGNVYQLLTVNPQWQEAAEVVLAPWLHALLVSKNPLCSFTGDNIATLPEKMALLIDNRVKTTTLNTPGTLAEQVSSEYDFMGWLKTHYLNKIYLADDVIQAQQLLTKLANDESVLCQDGTWLSHHFIVKGTSENNEHLLLKQAQYLEQSKQIELLTAELAVATKEVAVKQQRCDRLSEQQQEIDIQIQALKSALQVNQQQEKLNQQGQQYQQQQYKQTQQLIVQQQQKMAQLSEQLTALEKEQQTVNQAIVTEHSGKENTTLAELSVEKSQLQQQVEILTIQNKELTEHKHQLSLKLTKSLADAENITEHLSLLSTQQQQIIDQIKALNSNQNEQQKPLDEQQQQLQTWLAQQAEVEQQLIKQQKLLAENQEITDKYVGEKDNLQQKIDELTLAVNKHHLEVENNRLRSQNMVEQLENMGQVLADVLAKMPENIKENQWQANIVRLGKDIDILGPINLAAIEEYNRELAKKSFLDQQYQDLTDAISTLENAITKIDKQSRQKFKLTFDQVNNDLKRLFPQVFGGGSAYLDLTGEDLLETGVTIMARPPGKKNSTIHLLSGGEKALTALSLVFAIFRLNPAPFCMLDEVDAPLDDANVLRFCNLVKEMSKTVQFIYISHNKIAMEMAAHLTGVTMFEAGVSRMVNVDIEQAVAMAEMN